MRSEPTRIGVKCENGCPFLFYASKDGSNLGLIVKTFVPYHNCYRIFTNPKASTNFLAKLYKQKILEKHDYKVKDLKKDVEKELRVHVHYSKCKRARRMVLDAYSRTFTFEYSKLEAYAAELMKSNPNSTIKVELLHDELREGKRVFKGMFICLDACKRGWKSRCRLIIGLNGCFMKMEFKDELLVTIGRDPDEKNIPIAWACVKNGSKHNWSWFLTLLKEELDLGDDSNYTLISNLHKVCYIVFVALISIIYQFN